MLRPATILLTAALLLRPLTAPAQTPLTAPASAAKINAADLKWRKIILRHTTPNEVMERMDWQMTMSDPYAKNQGPPLTPAEANLPEGVTHIFPLQSNNSLLLNATEAGYKTCREIASVLDVAPRQVTIKVFLVAVPLGLKQEIDLFHPSLAVLHLRTANAVFCQPSPVTSYSYTTDVFDNDVTATIPFVLPFYGGPFSLHSSPINGSNILAVSSLCVTPHINSDSSITFNLDLAGLNPHPNSAIPSQPMTIVHTVSNGEMAAYDVTHSFPKNDYRKLLFVTLTALGHPTQ